jgi:hypothetical protein
MLRSSGWIWLENTLLVSQAGCVDASHSEHAFACLRRVAPCLARASGLRAATRPRLAALIRRVVAASTAQPAQGTFIGDRLSAASTEMIRLRRFDCGDPNFALGLSASLLSKTCRKSRIASASGFRASPKSSRHVFSPRRHQLSPCRACLAEVSAHLGHEAAITGGGFEKVSPAQRLFRDPVK